MRGETEGPSPARLLAQALERKLGVKLIAEDASLTLKLPFPCGAPPPDPRRSLPTPGQPDSDAQLAALALEHGLGVCSVDTDFARFTDLRWENPLAP